MMKLLRKYNKQLLAIFMAFLMIVFIGGSAIYEIFTPDPNRLVAESDLGTIKTYDVREIRATTTILTNLNYPWQMLGGMNSQPLSEIDWLLLNRETEKLGTALSPADARAQLNHDTRADQWERNAFQLRVKPRDIYKAAAQFGSIQQTLTSMYAAAEPSMAEVRTAARNALDKVKVQTIMIPAEVIVDEQLAGSEESLKELWEQYRATERGRGLNTSASIRPRSRKTSRYLISTRWPGNSLKKTRSTPLCGNPTN